MPTAALTTCSRMGCRNLTDRGRCPSCRQVASRATDAARGTAASRGYGAHHRSWRLAIIARDPLCVACLALEVMTPAKVADHILPVEWGGGWELGNGQGLCTHCHNVKRAHESHGRLTRVIPSRGLVVVGPKGGGRNGPAGDEGTAAGTSLARPQVLESPAACETGPSGPVGVGGRRG